MSISGVLNTSEDTINAWGGGYHDASGGYHEYVFSTSGDIMSTLGDIMSTLGFSIEIERIYQVAPLNAS